MVGHYSLKVKIQVQPLVLEHMNHNNPLLQFLEESNAIERVYGNTALQDALTAWKAIEDKPVIAIKDILRVHSRLMQNQPIEERYKGAWRDVPVWVGNREGKPFYAIDNLMQQWVSLANMTITNDWASDLMEEEIKQDHVAFETIHPFIDGNGRVGRILYNWQRIRVGLPIHVIHHGDEQWEYYKWFD